MREENAAQMRRPLEDQWIGRIRVTVFLGSNNVDASLSETACDCAPDVFVHVERDHRFWRLTQSARAPKSNS
jgi:hypothetical protein